MLGPKWKQNCCSCEKTTAFSSPTLTCLTRLADLLVVLDSTGFVRPARTRGEEIDGLARTVLTVDRWFSIPKIVGTLRMNGPTFFRCVIFISISGELGKCRHTSGSFLGMTRTRLVNWEVVVQLACRSPSLRHNCFRRCREKGHARASRGSFLWGTIFGKAKLLGRNTFASQSFSSLTT